MKLKAFLISCCPLSSLPALCFFTLLLYIFYLSLQPIGQIDKTILLEGGYKLHFIFSVEVTATLPSPPVSMSDVQYSCMVEYKQWTKCDYARISYFIYRYYNKLFNLNFFYNFKTYFDVAMRTIMLRKNWILISWY